MGHLTPTRFENFVCFWCFLHFFHFFSVFVSRGCFIRGFLMSFFCVLVRVMFADGLMRFVLKLNRANTSVSCVLCDISLRKFFNFFLLFWPFSTWFFLSFSSLSDGWECFSW